MVGLMRIPRFQSSGVPGAEPISLSAISYEASQKIQTNQNLTKMVKGFANDLMAAEANAEYGQKYNQTVQHLDTFWDGMAKGPRFDDNNEPTHHQLMPAWEKAVRQTLDKTEFRSRSARAQFQSDMQEYVTTKTADIRKEVALRQVNYAKGVVQQNLTHYLTDPEGVSKATEELREAMRYNVYTPEQSQTMLTQFSQQHADRTVTLQIAQATSMDELESIQSAMIDNPGNLTANDLESAMRAVEQRLDAFEDKMEVDQETTYTDMLVGIYTGEVVTEAQLAEALSGREIDPRHFESLTDHIERARQAPTVSDQDEVIEVTLNIGDYTPDQIMRNPNLTIADRLRLLSRLKDHKATIASGKNWQSTPNGRNAEARIRAAFPPEKVKTGLFAGVQSGEVSNTAAVLQIQLFDEVSKLPPEQREAQAIAIAKRIIEENRIPEEEAQEIDPEAQIAAIVLELPPGEGRIAALNELKRKGFKIPQEAYTRLGPGQEGTETLGALEKIWNAITGGDDE